MSIAELTVTMEKLRCRCNQVLCPWAAKLSDLPEQIPFSIFIQAQWDDGWRQMILEVLLQGLSEYGILFPLIESKYVPVYV